MCHFEHTPGEPMTWDHPGSPAETNLIAAYVRGWDCYRLLSDEQIHKIETLIEERA